MGIDPTVAHPSGEDTNHLGVFLTQRSDVSAKRRVSVWMHVHGISLKLPVKICPTNSPLSRSDHHRDPLLPVEGFEHWSFLLALANEKKFAVAKWMLPKVRALRHDHHKGHWC